jgi:HNH endonuclease
MPVDVRFWRHVSRRGFDECWLWSGATGRGGYGVFTLWAGQLDCEQELQTNAQRVAFRLIHGYWPEPFALHGCDNPPCCNALNPAHVREGTHQENMDEMVARERGWRQVPAEVRVLIREACDGQTSQQVVAQRFGVSQQLVSLIYRATA